MPTKTADQMYDQLMGLIGDMLVKETPEPVQEDKPVCWTQYRPLLMDEIKEEWKTLTWQEQLEVFVYINRKAE